LFLPKSPGKHNQVQRAIIEEFAPRFAPNADLLYIGDTTKKNIVMDTRTLPVWKRRHHIVSEPNRNPVGDGSKIRAFFKNTSGTLIPS
jgi:hypothetical protein